MSKEIQGSLGFWIPSSGFRIPVSGFLVSGTWIPDSESLDSRFQKQNFPDSARVNLEIISTSKKGIRIITLISGIGLLCGL